MNEAKKYAEVTNVSKEELKQEAMSHLSMHIVSACMQFATLPF
jgi:hypothetical protein